MNGDDVALRDRLFGVFMHPAMAGSAQSYEVFVAVQPLPSTHAVVQFLIAVTAACTLVVLALLHHPAGLGGDIVHGSFTKDLISSTRSLLWWNSWAISA